MDGHLTGKWHRWVRVGVSLGIKVHQALLKAAVSGLHQLGPVEAEAIQSRVVILQNTLDLSRGIS